MLICYARTSTVEQMAGLEAQQVALAATRCSKVFSEQASSVGQRGSCWRGSDWDDLVLGHQRGIESPVSASQSYSSALRFV
ncbi:MAG: hypothetical protein ABS87_11695 [Sphingomonas sp. SCN 67-18]|nr:MAG: hypothetical protein ABS87_11695 [Sphingomonas sp. SCN 67-18]